MVINFNTALENIRGDAGGHLAVSWTMDNNIGSKYLVKPWVYVTALRNTYLFHWTAAGSFAEAGTKVGELQTSLNDDITYYVTTCS